MSPTQRTLREARKRGYRAGIVERWLRFAHRKDKEGQSMGFGKRQDLFGIIDIIAITPELTIGIQSCGNTLPQHLEKLLYEKNQECYDWLSCSYRALEIWSWRKVKRKPGKKQMVWRPRIHRFSLEELDI
jgi:hypothetical protein